MVEGYRGRPGEGKTLTMVARAYKAKQKGRRVFANIPLIDTRTVVRREFWFFGRYSVQPRCEKTYGRSWADGFISSIDEMLQLDNCLVLLDEVHMWMSSDKWKDIPFEIRRYLAQQRKEGIDIWWTAQSDARVFNVIRELTATLWSCIRYGPLICLKGVDPETREDMGKRWVWLGPQHYGLYNTEFIVGDGRETQGEFGFNARYRRLAAERAARVGTLEAVVEARGWDRFEMPGGRVVYGVDRNRTKELSVALADAASAAADAEHAPLTSEEAAFLLRMWRDDRLQENGAA